MQVNATLQRKVTALAILLSMLWCIGWPLSSAKAQQVYATSQTNGRTGVCLLCGPAVTNPGNAVSASRTDYATFNMDGVAVGVSVFETLQFPSVNPNPGCDSLVIQIGSSQALLSANLLSNITVTTYNGATSNNDAVTVTPSLLRLLDDSSTALIVLRPAAAFDRVEIRESALVAALSSLRLYFAYHAPINLNNITIANGGTATVCAGSPITLSASVPAGGATIQWFTTATGGTPVAATNNYTFTPTANTTLYAGAVLGNCSSTTRQAVTVNVNPTPPTPTVSATTATVCGGQTATFSINNPQAGVTYTWYDAATGGTPQGTGSTFITPALATTTSYYAEAALATGCTSPARTQVTATVNATPAAPVVTPATQAIAGGHTATINISNPVAGATYNWYTTPTGGSPIATGTSFTTPVLYTNATYYAAVTSAQGCENSSRTLATVTVTINNNVSCSFATTQQSPVYSGGLSICALCSVNNPNNAIDTDTTTASSLTTPVSLAGYLGQLLTYPHAYLPGDSIRLLLGLPGGLADVQALGAIRVETYNNGVANGDAVFVNNPLLTLNLLGGERFNATVAATKPFNAVLVSLGGVGTLITTLNIYGASVIVPRPVVNPASASICSGSTASFTVTAPTGGADIAWYTVPVGGTAAGTGTTFTTPALSTTTTYYVEAGRYGCANPVRTPVTVQVNTQPAAPVPATSNDSVCAGQTATLAVTPVTGVTFSWYASNTASTPLATGTNFTTPALTTSTTYYVSAGNGGCSSATRTAITAVVAAAPTGVTVTPAGATIQAGQSVTFTASAASGAANFNWFTTATGGTSIASGATFTSPLLFSNTTYYVEASNPSTGCVSPQRVAVTVNVINPNVPDISCGAAGSQSASANGLCVGCYVENPGLAVDNDPATGSTMHVVLGLLGGYVQQTFQFGSVSNGDSVHIGLSFPTGLADVGLLSSVQVQSYNGNTANNDLTSLSPQMLTLRLATAQATANFLPAAPYDRIVVRLNSGVLGALSAVNVDYVQRFVSTPTPQADSVYACSGQPAVLHASSPANATFRWYTQPTGGTPVGTGADFTTPAVNANTVYYLEAVSADGCPSPSRAAVNVFAGLPGAEIAPDNVTVNSGDQATFNIVNPNPGYTYTWYDAPSGGNVVHTGTSFTTPALTSSTSYYVVVSNGTGCSSTVRSQVTVNINIPIDPAPCSYANTQTSPVSTAVCLLCSITDPGYAVDSNRNTATKITAAVGIAGYYGQTLHFSNTYPAGDSVQVELEVPGSVVDAQILGGIRFETYNGATANGDGRMLSDSVVNLSLLSGSNKFRVTVPVSKAFDGINISVGGLVSAVTSVLVYDAAAVVPSPTVPVPDGICSGTTATLKATAPANADITWYTQAVGGTAVGSGYTFTTPALTRSTTYYVAAGRYGCSSPARTAVTVNVGNPAAAPTAAGAQVCAGTTATLTATAPANVTFQWFANATDTTVIFTGASFTTGVLNADTTFYVASNSNGCRSGRTAVPVTVGHVPTAFNVTPSSVTVAYGSSVVFTATAADTAAIFNYYTTATGGTPVFTGKVFQTPSLTANTTYYAEATTKAGCATNFRIPLTVTVLADTSNGLVPCDAATTQTNTANGICVGCYVDNPGYAIDSSTATGSTLHTILGLLGGYVSQTLIFPSVSEVGDSVRIDLTVASGLADVGLLSTVQVGTYNGTTFNNDLQAVNSGPITLRLISNTQAYFTFKPSQSFDRVEVRLNSGLAQAINAITIRDAYRKVAVPVVSGSDTARICAGQSASLAVAPVNNVTMRWYTQSIGGTPVFSGNNYVTPNLTNSTTFWVEAVRTSTDCATQPRVPVTVIVLPTPNVPQVLADTITICSGSKATFNATAPAGALFQWYSTATGGTPLDTGATFTTPALTQSTIYYLEAASETGGCANATRKAVLANVISMPPPPTVTPAGDTICAHNSVVLQASSTTPGLVYNWYSSATGGTAIATGPNFTTPVLDSSITYYVESVAGTCSSSTRTAAIVTVNPLPTAPVVTPASAAVNAGTTQTFAADSSRPGITNRWYTVATGGSPVYTGNKYTTPPLTANVTYYVESMSTSGCVSARTAVSVTVNSVTPGCSLVTAQTNDVNGLCIGCAVTNPGNAIDADTTTYTTLSALVNLVNGYVSQTLVMPTPGAAGDTARFALEYPGQLVSASLIGGLQVQSFNGATPNGDLHNVNMSTITLNVLNGSNKFYLDVVPAAAYDRIEIRLNSGAVSAAQTLRIYYGGLKPITPAVDPANVTICAGSTATLHATAPAVARIEWYSAPVGGTLLYTGADYTTPALTTTTTYYVQTVRIANNCPNPNRIPVTVSVLPVPTVTITGGNLSICSGTPVSIAATVTPATATVRWYDAATGGNLVYTGNPLVTSNLTKDTIFYAEGYNGTCSSAARTAVKVSVGKAVTPPVLANNNVSICSGQTATLKVTSDTTGLVFRWYTAAIGGTPVFTGATYITGALTANAVYYVEAANAGGACNTASARTVANVQVSAVPTVPVPTATADTVCLGQPVTLAVSNPQAGLTYQWYATASGGTPLFTGAIFNIASADAAATYYVQASSGAGCTSTSRAAVKVVVRTAPATPTLTIASQNICTGQQATFTINAPVTGLTYSWYDAASGGNLLATGTSFTTPALTAAATYYVAAYNANCAGSTRAVAAVTVGTPTTPTLVSNNLNVCSGQSATFQVSSPVSGVTYNWYTVATGGTPAHTGTTFTTSAITATTVFYVEAAGNTGCSGASARITATATMVPAPGTPTLAAGSAVTCAGGNITFTVSAPQTGITYQWFDAATGGTLLSTGTSFTASNVVKTTTYYVEGLSNGGCSSVTRAAATATVATTPVNPTLTADNITTCIGGTASFAVASPDNNLVYTWWDAASGGTQVGAGATFTSPALSADKTYFVQAAVANGSCTSPARTPAHALVTNTLAVPTVANAATVACAGQPVTISVQNPLNGVLYRWYTTATGGTAVFTGPDYTITGITASQTYYVEAATTAGCVSTSRAAAAITVSTAPATPTLAADQVGLCTGQQATLTVNNPQTGVQYKWYTTATGGTALATGATFKTPAITATTNYYVEAQNTTGGCASAARAIATVSLLPAGAIPTVTGDQVVCPGSSATLTASSTVPGAVFSWYTSETATTPVYTGNSFTTPALTASTTYFVGAAPGTFCGSADKISADVNVEQQLPAPNVHVCDSSKQDQVTFCWDPVQGAQGYEVSVNGGSFIAPSSGTTGTSHTVTGLQSGQRVAFEVRALGQLACATSGIAAIEGRAASPKGDVIYVPNVFSPNGDGSNDKLYVYSESIATMEFIVYNKWGQQIFISKDIHTGWDGTVSGSPQPTGVYVWALRATMTDGTQQTRYGSITLVR